MNFVITTEQHTGPLGSDYLPPNPVVSRVPFDYTGEEEFPFESQVRIYADGTVDIAGALGLSCGYGSVREAVHHWRESERLYAEHCEQQEREQAEVERTGLHICPSCGERSLRVTSTPTRNYGGGTDTFERCERTSCEYAEVYV